VGCLVVDPLPSSADNDEDFQKQSMTTEQNTHCVFYRDLFGGWRWEWCDEEGNIRDSKQSYDTRDECVQQARAAGIYKDNTPVFAAKTPAKKNPLEGRSLLCAYPDPALQRFLQQTFESVGLVFASSGREALTRINSSVYDAFVLDYWLPDWSGVSLCREIRKTDPHVPICFYSNARSEDATKRALRAGADLFLSVPTEAHTLRGRVETLVTSREKNVARAQAEENRAIQDELHRRASQAIGVAERAKESAARAIERGARAKAMKAFIEAGGTRANFERLWPELYSSVFASQPLPGARHI
jgi:DNA-binding response OmpR family regulator